MTKITVPEVLPLMWAVYERHAAGCCAHIVVDDDNIRDSDAEFCLEQAKEQGHKDCIVLCEALVKMSPTQRHKLYRADRPPYIPDIVKAMQR